MNLPVELRTIVMERCRELKPKLKEIKNGEVQIIVHDMRLYSTRTLPDLLRRHGFNVDFTFVVSADGHLISADFFTGGVRMGVIVSLPEPTSAPSSTPGAK